MEINKNLQDILQKIYQRKPVVIELNNVVFFSYKGIIFKLTGVWGTEFAECVILHNSNYISMDIFVKFRQLQEFPKLKTTDTFEKILTNLSNTLKMEKRIKCLEKL